MISQTSRYAIRAMVWMAKQPLGTAFTAKALAESTGVSADYLAKILRRLVVAGLLTSRRGPGGGFILAKPPADVRFLDVLLAVDQMQDDRECAFGWGQCDADLPCPIHTPWAELQATIHSWAERHTLADGA